MTAQHIKQLKDEDIIGFHRLLPPFRAKRMDWRRFPALSERQAIPPPPLAALPILETRPPDLVHAGNGFLQGYIDPDM
jgi:hypothetical protein